MITRTWAWPADPYAKGMPPPLCFTVPAGSKPGAAGKLITTGGFGVTLRKPKLMMEPDNPATWQRPYRFTQDGPAKQPMNRFGQ
jgi:hypothetical protein